MKMSKSLVVLGILGLASTPTMAKDCGFAPDYYPSLPDISTSTRSDMTIAVQAVRAFGEVTNAHLSCLDETRSEMFLNMSKEQQSRWIEDYNKIVEDLTSLQEGLNFQIRTFNTRREEQKVRDTAAKAVNDTSENNN